MKPELKAVISGSMPENNNAVAAAISKYPVFVSTRTSHTESHYADSVGMVIVLP